MTPPTAAAQLPVALLARILQRVPQQQRLSVCVLVSKAWAAAAAAATHSISLDLSKAAEPDEVLPTFQAWLQQHGSNVSSLQVNSLSPASLQSILAVKPLLQLRDLSAVNLQAPSTAAVLPVHLTSLTRLRLAGSAALPDQAQALTRLHALELEGAAFQPRMLFGMTQLQRLKLHVADEPGGGLLPAAADTQPPFATLLAAIAGLTQLQHLQLVVCDTATVDVSGLQPQAFAGLTASSHLQLLHVKLSIDTAQPGAVPGRDVLQHMFPVGRRLRQLHSLVLGASGDDFSWHVPASDLARIAASCPSLHALGINHMLEQGADLTPLLQFTGLKSLCAAGWVFDDGGAAVVAQLTQLTRLEWECYEPYLSGAGLLQLSALTQLQQLLLTEGEGRVDQCFLIEEVLDEELPLHLASSPQAGPVWLQIHRLLGVPEPVLSRMRQQQQQSLAELQELQQLGRCVAVLEQQVKQAQALGFLPGDGAEHEAG